MAGWDGVDVEGIIRAALNIPVILNNDTNVGALAESRYGAAAGESDFAYVKLGTGIGCGLVINGEIYRGSSGVAGEMGHFTVDSAGPGAGTTVTIRLPASQGTVMAPRPWASSVDDVRLDGVSVLVVDDERDSREMLAVALEQRGASVEQCGDAAAAIAAIAARPFDVLLADIAMPDVDGYELLRRVRDLGFTLPAVAVTAFARSDDRQRAFASGYSRYCAKPIDEIRVARAVLDVLPRR